MKKDDKSPKFEICFYEGYKNSETPRSVIIGNHEFPIEEIIWRKRVLKHKSRETHEIFKCKMEGEIVLITIYDSGKWSLTFQ